VRITEGSSEEKFQKEIQFDNIKLPINYEDEYPEIIMLDKNTTKKFHENTANPLKRGDSLNIFGKEMLIGKTGTLKRSLSK